MTAIPPRTPVTRPRSRPGFTLIEVLVALAVFAIGALALVRAGTENVRVADGLNSRALADMVAENRLVTVMMRGNAPDTGTRTGETRMAGRAFQWRQQVRAGNNGLLSVRITVHPPDGGQELARLETVRAP
ncbi:type II secretion system minor pseudopilin GspI [Yunchengibacter salinarum]|uniref:type II secretion system minor pseudopilin GspI n=1 Tax=Yunchengibacter salinarum TaxID=3133399 RepID=UPI0035B6358F